MKQILAMSLIPLMLSSSLAAEEEPSSLMQRGLQLFFEGFMEEVAPALDEITTLLEEAGPAVQNFVVQMGPKLRDVLEEVEDWSVYAAPEMLPNGDIIMRRKPDDQNKIPAPPVTEDMPQAEL